MQSTEITIAAQYLGDLAVAFPPPDSGSSFERSHDVRLLLTAPWDSFAMSLREVTRPLDHTGRVISRIGEDHPWYSLRRFKKQSGELLAKTSRHRSADPLPMQQIATLRRIFNQTLAMFELETVPSGPYQASIIKLKGEIDQDEIRHNLAQAFNLPLLLSRLAMEALQTSTAFGESAQQAYVLYLNSVDLRIGRNFWEAPADRIVEGGQTAVAAS